MAAYLALQVIPRVGAHFADPPSKNIPFAARKPRLVKVLAASEAVLMSAWVRVCLAQMNDTPTMITVAGLFRPS